MKILWKTFSVISFFIVLFLGVKIYRNIEISRDLKNENKDKLKKSAEILNNCFDLENKSSRTLNESMHLIEFCLEKYGSEK